MRLITAFLFCALALPASAQIYKYTDDRGNVVFSDQPPEGRSAQTIELAPTNRVEAQAPADTPAHTEGQDQAAVYKVLHLKDLPSADAIRANNGTFSVGVEIQPRLQKGHTLRLILDGRPYGQPSTALRLPLNNIDRGEHSLAVEVLSGDTPLQTSQTQTFTVQRVHTNNPAIRPPKPQPKPAP